MHKEIILQQSLFLNQQLDLKKKKKKCCKKYKKGKPCKKCPLTIA